MALLAEKLVHFLKFPFKPDESSASLLDFRSKTSDFLSQIQLKPAGSHTMPKALFKNCFEIMHAANRAFAELVAEIDFPMSQWGATTTHRYLGYTLTLMDMLNSITSRLSHLNMVKISILHGLSLVEDSPNSAAKYLIKIDRGNNVGGGFKVEKYPGIEMKAGCQEKEGVILEALMELKKIGLFALGLVLTGLWSDAKKPGEVDDHVKKVVGSRLCKEMKGVVEEVSCTAERLATAISAGESCDEGVRELKKKLEVMESAIFGIEKEVNSLFSEVLAARNKVLDNIRFG